MKKLSIILILMSVLSIYASAQSSFIVKESGKGTPILMLPGFTCPGDVWDETVNHLGNNYTYHQVSYAGFNHIDPIAMPWYSTIQQDLGDYIRQNDLKEIVVIGHSMGGMLAMELAADFPDRVSKLILVDALPSIKEVMMPQVKTEDIVYESPYNQQVLNMDDQAFHQTAAFMAQNMTNTSSEVEKLTSWIENADRKTYVYGYTDLLRLDLRDRLADIECETLILSADFPTKALALKTVEGQFENLKNKQIKVADGSKHFIMFDQKEWFFKEVGSFLQ